MAKRIDWRDFAHELFKERERIQDAAPKGIEVTVSLEDYGYGAKYHVRLTHPETKDYGSGEGSTPARALDEARASFKACREKRLAVKQLFATS